MVIATLLTPSSRSFSKTLYSEEVSNHSTLSFVDMVVLCIWLTYEYPFTRYEISVAFLATFVINMSKPA